MSKTQSYLSMWAVVFCPFHYCLSLPSFLLALIFINSLKWSDENEYWQLATSINGNRICVLINFELSNVDIYCNSASTLHAFGKTLKCIKSMQCEYFVCDKRNSWNAHNLQFELINRVDILCVAGFFSFQFIDLIIIIMVVVGIILKCLMTAACSFTEWVFSYVFVVSIFYALVCLAAWVRRNQANEMVQLWLIIDTMAKRPRAVINLSIFIHQINITTELWGLHRI